MCTTRGRVGKWAVRVTNTGAGACTACPDVGLPSALIIGLCDFHDSYVCNHVQGRNDSLRETRGRSHMQAKFNLHIINLIMNSHPRCVKSRTISMNIVC